MNNEHTEIPRDELTDRVAPRPVLRRDVLHRGSIWNLVRDQVDLGPGGIVSREVLDHPGAVGVLVLDEDMRVLVLRQYRHPVGRELWEIPAGLMDKPGEDPLAAAQRELFEEADLRAARWHVLADFYTSPGGTSEPLRIYLAQELSDVVEADRFARHEEEIDMEVGWVALDDLVGRVLLGQLHNPTLVVGALAAYAARSQHWRTLRPADTEWPEQVTRRLIEDADS